MSDIQGAALDAASADAANDTASGTDTASKSAEKSTAQRREIPGNLLYTTTPGSLKSVLDAVLKAEVPDRFSKDFIAQVLGIKGGSAAQQISVLKRMGLVGTDGTPTERYSRFRSDMDRSGAALESLRSAYQAVFQKNEFAHKLSDTELKDVVAQITGLKKTDPIVAYMVNTFEKIRSFITDRNVSLAADDHKATNANPPPENHNVPAGNHNGTSISGLNYVINITLPQSNSIDTYNMIFRSLRENILDWQR